MDRRDIFISFCFFDLDVLFDTLKAVKYFVSFSFFFLGMIEDLFLDTVGSHGTDVYHSVVIQ